MKRLGMWGLLVLSGMSWGCAGSDDPGGADAGTSSGSTSDGSTTAPTTTISGTSTDGTSSSTTDAGESSSSTGADATSSSSSGGDSSSTGPGCELGTEDCACDNGACQDDLVCTGDDLCEPPPNCPQEDSEPNNTEAEAPDLGEFNDFDPTFETVDGRLPSADDEDWFSFHCDDTVAGQVDLAYEMDTNIPVRVCQFIACDDPEDPTVTCPENSEAATSPDGLPGCCSEQLTLSVNDVDCNSGNDDSGTIYTRVDMPAQDMCVSYDLGVRC